MLSQLFSNILITEIQYNWFALYDILQMSKTPRWNQYSRTVKHSTGNVVNNIVITVKGARWAMQLVGDHS